jgi:hypothetical protein
MEVLSSLLYGPIILQTDLRQINSLKFFYPCLVALFAIARAQYTPNNPLLTRLSILLGIFFSFARFGPVVGICHLF